jgi:isoleucyl-tRNA synthetase
LHDPQLEREIEISREVEQAGSAARQQAERKLRWPIARAVVSAPTAEVVEAVEAQRDLLEERLNARGIEIVGPDEDWAELGYSAEADMSELGPAFGDDAGRVMNALNEAYVEEWSLDALEAAVEEATGLDADLDESMVEPVLELPDGVSSAEFSVEHGGEQVSGQVYVDTTLTDDIESEGYAREVIRRVQEMRKDLELDIQAGMRLSLDVADDRVADLVREHEDLIAEEVRGEFGAVEDGHRKEWDVEGVTMTIAIEKIAEATA